MGDGTSAPDGVTRLPNINATKLIQALQRAGFVALRHHKTSHLLLEHPITGRRTIVPKHSGELKRGLMKAILKQCGLTEEQFRGLL